jgi:hypothetical protein
MRSSDAFPGKYLRAADILDREVPVVLAGLKHEEMADGELKWVLYFEGKTRGLVLNRTNWDALEEAHGDSDDWRGKSAVLFTIKTKDPSGKTVDGIRIKVPKQQTATARPMLKSVKQQSEDPAADMDEIPF